MFLSHSTIFQSGSVTLVSVVVMLGKKLSGKPKLPKVSTYFIRLQDSELKSWLSA